MTAWIFVLVVLLPIVLSQQNADQPRGILLRGPRGLQQQQPQQEQPEEIVARLPREGENGCPIMEPKPGVCANACDSDYDCAFGKICCTAGCSRSCVNRVVRPGTEP